MTLALPKTETRTAAELVETLGEFLKPLFPTIKILTRTRIPIVKFSHKDYKIDLGINNMLALYNSKLIKTYIDIDPRARQLAIIIKYWTKRRGIADTYSGTLSSYAYTLMVIHYLQIIPNPILPNLQGLARGPPVECEGWDVSFCSGAEVDRYWTDRQVNRKSVGDLLIGFFEYWGSHFDWRSSVVSVRLGTIIDKETKGWGGDPEGRRYNRDQETEREVGEVVDVLMQMNIKLSGPDTSYPPPLPNQTDEDDAILEAKRDTRSVEDIRYRKQRYFFCIEDPFEIKHNLGRVADRNG